MNHVADKYTNNNFINEAFKNTKKLMQLACDSSKSIKI